MDIAVLESRYVVNVIVADSLEIAESLVEDHQLVEDVTGLDVRLGYFLNDEGQYVDPNPTPPKTPSEKREELIQVSKLVSDLLLNECFFIYGSNTYRMKNYDYARAMAMLIESAGIDVVYVEDYHGRMQQMTFADHRNFFHSLAHYHNNVRKAFFDVKELIEAAEDEELDNFELLPHYPTNSLDGSSDESLPENDKGYHHQMVNAEDPEQTQLHLTTQAQDALQEEEEDNY